MKKAVPALFLFIFFVSCGKPVLHIYNWSDYINEELVKQFEVDYGCRVIMDYYDSNESMYAKLKAGASGYDICFPSGYMVAIMSRQGMLEPVDHNRIPNLVNLDENYLPFTLDEEMVWSVPYMISNTGIGYLGDMVGTDFQRSWGVFGDPRYKGRMTMLNDYREAIGAALKYLGYSINTIDENELNEAKELLISWKKNLAKFEADQYKNGLVSGEFLIAQGYNGDIMQVMEENENIVYFIPEEGAALATDNMVILKSAREKDLAYAFINFLLDGKNAAENTEYVWFLAPNKASYPYLSEEVLSEPSIFIPEETMKKCEVIRDLGEHNVLYSRIWEEVKAAE